MGMLDKGFAEVRVTLEGERIGKLLLGKGNFLGQIFENVNAGDEKQRKEVELIDGARSELVREGENLLMKRTFAPLKLAMEKLGVREIGLEIVQ